MQARPCDSEVKELSVTLSDSGGLSKYEKLGQVGEGTFGKVYKARSLVHVGQIVALKRIRLESEKEGFPFTALREVKLFRRLKHKNILNLIEMIRNSGDIYLVFDYMDHDLTGIIGHPQFTYEPPHIKCIIDQILQGLKYLHDQGILHRDLKGSNILLNNRGEVKLADFGLARIFNPHKTSDYTNRVITLWYRPPELLLGATTYGPPVDMWGVGCIMIELFTKKAAFQGNNEISQLSAIYKVLGTATEEIWPSLKELPWYHLLKPRVIHPCRLESIYESTIPSSALSLIKQFLIFNPEMRITSLNALASSYFSHEPAACLPHEYASLSYSSQSRLPTPEGDWHEYETKLRRKRSAATITASSNSTHSVGSNEDISATLTSSPPSSTKKSKLTYHPNANKNYHKKPK